MKSILPPLTGLVSIGRWLIHPIGCSTVSQGHSDAGGIALNSLSSLAQDMIGTGTVIRMVEHI